MGWTGEISRGRRGRAGGKRPGLLVHMLLGAPGAAIYAALLSGHVALRQAEWCGALGGLILLYALIGRLWPSIPARAHAALLCGLGIGFAVRLSGIGWLHLLYLPYVAAVAGWMPGAAIAAGLSVAVFEAGHFIAPYATLSEEAALSAIALATALIARVLGPAARAVDTSAPAPYADDVHAATVDMSGLDHEEDEELRELLRMLVLSARASSATLFLYTDGELFSRLTSARGPSPVPRWFASDTVRLRHTLVTGNLGSETRPEETASEVQPARGEAVSIAASPVFDGSVILGVLAVSSPRVEAFDFNCRTVLELGAAQAARALARERVRVETDESLRRLGIIQDVGAKLTSTLEVNAIVEVMAEAMSLMADAEVNVLLKVQGTESFDHKFGPERSEATRRLSLAGTLSEMALSDRERKYFSNLRGFSKPVLPFDRGSSSALILPLVYGDEPLGVAVVSSNKTDFLSPRQVDVLAVLASQAVTALHNAHLHARFRRMAVTDGMTGLFNHSHFIGILERELARVAEGRTDAGLAILLLDLDHFKSVNDTYGHQLGDKVLAETAAVISDSLPERAAAARYGGEEFIVLLPDTALQGAARIAQYMRQELKTRVFDAGGAGSFSVTASIGVAATGRAVMPKDDLVRMADEALYEAKRSGRDRVVTSGGT